MKINFKISNRWDTYDFEHQGEFLMFYPKSKITKDFDYKSHTTYSERFINLMWPGWKV